MTLDRCAVHPARPAEDRCPACARPRCGADAKAGAGRACLACLTPGAPGAAPGRLELVVRAGLAALLVAQVGGWIGTEYVGTRWFSVLAPGLVGLACSGAAAAASRRGAPTLVLGIAAVAAVLAAALGFRLVPGGQNLFTPAGDVLPPYVSAVVGALLGPLLFAPPRRAAHVSDSESAVG